MHATNKDAMKCENVKWIIWWYEGDCWVRHELKQVFLPMLILMERWNTVSRCVQKKMKCSRMRNESVTIGWKVRSNSREWIVTSISYCRVRPIISGHLTQLANLWYRGLMMITLEFENIADCYNSTSQYFHLLIELFQFNFSSSMKQLLSCDKQRCDEVWKCEMNNLMIWGRCWVRHELKQVFLPMLILMERWNTVSTRVQKKIRLLFRLSSINKLSRRINFWTQECWYCRRRQLTENQ